MTGTMSTATSASRTAAAASVVALEAARGVDLGHSLGQARLLGHVGPAVVDRGDDFRIDVDRGHVPAVAGELDGQRQAHLAGADDDGPADRAGLAGPRAAPLRAAPWVQGLTGGLIEPPRKLTTRRGAGDDGHSAASLEGRSERSIGAALGGGGQQGVGDGDGPEAVLAVDVRPLARSQDAHEFVELGAQRLDVLDRDLGHVAGEGRGVAADHLRPSRRSSA